MQLQGDYPITHAIRITVLRLWTNCLRLLCKISKGLVSTAWLSWACHLQQPSEPVRGASANPASNPTLCVVIFLHFPPLGVGLSCKLGRTWLDRAKNICRAKIEPLRCWCVSTKMFARCCAAMQHISQMKARGYETSRLARLLSNPCFVYQHHN
jgi:hypothetical protein